MGLALETSIRQLKGVGDRRAAQYEKLGIRRVDDLLRHYPRSYEDWSAVVPIAGAPVGRPCCIRGTPLRAPGEHVVRRGLTLYKFAVSDGENQLQVTLFNNKYAAAKVRPGEPLLLFGTVVRGPRHFEMASPLLEPGGGRGSHPSYLPPDRRADQPDDRSQRCAGFPACRPGTGQRSPARRSAAGAQPGRPAVRPRKHPFPGRFRGARRGPPPAGVRGASSAAAWASPSQGTHAGEAGAVMRGDHTEEFLRLLPFTLTGAQRRAIADCVADMQGASPMSRLIQGDVGSGKTAVAAGGGFHRHPGGMAGRHDGPHRAAR